MASFSLPLAGPLGGDDAGNVPAALGHVAVALSRVVEQYKAQPNIVAFVTALATQTQALDDAAVQLTLLTSIDDSSGLQLDHIGSIVNEARQGFDDASYRLHLKARVILNKGSGTIEDIIRLFAQLVGEGVSVTLREEFPASITVTIGGLAVDATFAPYLVLLLGAAKAAGVKAILQWQTTSDADSFRFAGALGKGFDLGIWANAAYA